MLLVLSRGEGDPAAVRSADIASYLGATVHLADVVPVCATDIARSRLWDDARASAGLIVTAELLEHLLEREDDRHLFRERLLAASSLFAFGFRPEHLQLIQWLTDGALTGVEPATLGVHGELPLAGAAFTREIAGTEFPPNPAEGALVFVTAPGYTDGSPLITLSQRPTFIRLNAGACNLFLSTGSHFPDPQQRVTHEKDVDQHCLTLLPFIVYVRAATGPFCWRAGWRGARLIIDDPLLRRRYGCLNFSQLFDSMRRHHYGATVAFIPWNAGRTSRDLASFFQGVQNRFSVCVHGCDHTNKEYGLLDEGNLASKSRLAMDRMRRHEARTGIGFEPIMVFPQGRFSNASLRALRSADFLAAVNSTRFPVDGEAAALGLGDLLQPATTSHGFPVFGRRYPRSVFPFALDLFLGKPAFIVEHHEFFRDGLPALEALVNRLNTCQPDLSWESLRHTVERTCWKRALSATSWEVRLFSDAFTLTNESDRCLSYRFLKKEPEPDAAATLHVNGNVLAVARRGDDVVFELDLDPGTSARVRFQRAASQLQPRVFVRPGHWYAGKVLARRALSEFRDEVLVRHPVMLAAAKRMVRLLKADAPALPGDSST